MQDVIKNKITSRIGNNSFTNVSYVHTCSISSMNLISANIKIMHSEVIQVSCNVVGGTEIRVPHVVEAIRG
jgi:hypothetical protein